MTLLCLHAAGAGRAEWSTPGRSRPTGKTRPSISATDACPSCLRDWWNTGFHPILDWRLAADTLDILLDGQVHHDRWKHVRAAALTGVTQAFQWTILDDGPVPVIDTGQGLIYIVHPLQNIDAGLIGGIPTAHGTALPFDVFNFDRRPGEIYRRL